MSAEDNDFDIAKKVADLLKGAGKDRQQKILRWVAENFDVPLVGAAPGSPPGGSPPLPPSGQTGQQGRTLDIKSFVDAKSPKSDNQFATVVAYYYRFEAPAEERKETITAETLQDATRLAGRSRMARPKDTLNNAKKQGYLDSVDRGQYRVNTVGENLVAMALPGGSAAAPTARRPSAKAAGGKRPTTRNK